MWLPPDERRLLAGLYRSIGKVGGEYAFREDWLAKLLHGDRTAPEYGEEPDDPSEPKGPWNQSNVAVLKAGISRVCHNRQLVQSVLSLLAARSLITLERHTTEMSVVIVGLNLEGYDLGRQYSSWSSRVTLWLREHKDSWFWMSAVAFMSVLGTLLIPYIGKRLIP
jgi:hypothetical protein